MMEGFEQVSMGMSMNEVEAILGLPEESHPTSFGARKMTTWAYHVGGRRLFARPRRREDIAARHADEQRAHPDSAKAPEHVPLPPQADHFTGPAGAA